MGTASVRVHFGDGRVAWTSFAPHREEVCPVLWPGRAEAWRAGPFDIADRFRESESYGPRQAPVHSELGTILVDRDRCVPVAVELVLGGVASWWTGLASGNGAILATNLVANEVRLRERGLFRPHPDYLPFQIRVTGPAWDAMDWSDVAPDGQPRVSPAA